MQNYNLVFEPYNTNDEHIYDSIYDVNQLGYQINSLNNNTDRLQCTSFVMNDIHDQKSAVSSSDPIETRWRNYWNWCSNFSVFTLSFKIVG